MCSTYNIEWYDTSIKGGNALRGLRVKRARDDIWLFNPPQASLLLRDEDDCCPNLPSATSEECVIGHGILAGTYLAEYRYSLK